MPTLSPWNAMQWVAGGAGGVVSVSGLKIYPPDGSAQGWHWLSPGVIVTPWFKDGQPGQWYRAIAADSGDVIDNLLVGVEGISEHTAGFGHWAVTTPHGVYIDGVNHGFTVAPVAFGPNTLAWFPWGAQGLRLRNLSTGQDTWLSNGYCVDVTVPAEGQAFWREGSTIRHFGIPWLPQEIPTTVPSFGWTKPFQFQGRGWVAYQETQAPSRIVAHPAHDASTGKVLGTGECYRLDVNSELAVWSSTKQDLPEHIRVARLAEPPMVALRPSPEPVPEPEPNPMPEVPSLFPIVQAVWTKYGGQRRGEMVNEIAWRGNGNTASGPWGLSRKTGGANAEQPRTGEKIGHDVVQHKPSGKLFDVFTDSGPIWAEAHPHNDPARIWLPAVAPLDASEEPDEPGEPGEPPPVSGIADRAIVALIEAYVGPIHAAMQETIDILQAKVDAIQIPEPGPAFPERIALRSERTGKLLCNDANRPEGHQVQADDRDGAGPWETWWVEPQ